MIGVPLLALLLTAAAVDDDPPGDDLVVRLPLPALKVKK
jgi:hypothetical protein